MINKFQQGGKLQQLELIFAMIDLQPEEAIKQLVQSGAKPEEIMLIVLVGALLGKIRPEVASAIQQMFQQLLQAAKHGAKLQYLKSLKHQCADNEELYYYKKGGSVGCGCKKKEDGGEVVKASTGVELFREDLKKKKLNTQQQSKWTNTEDNELKKLSEKKNLTPQEKQRLQQLRNKFKNSSNTKDYEMEEGKKGMKVEKDCGGAVAKFKKAFRSGGNLNSIRFYLKNNK